MITAFEAKKSDGEKDQRMQEKSRNLAGCPTSALSFRLPLWV